MAQQWREQAQMTRNGTEDRLGLDYKSLAMDLIQYFCCGDAFAPDSPQIFPLHPPSLAQTYFFQDPVSNTYGKK